MERLGRYELVARLAQGGMGEIFLARLEGAAGFAKLYAIKRILPQFANDNRFRKMLIDEAQIASKMAHGNICQVYELGETAGQLYIVMEYLEGVTLLPLLRACNKQRRPLELGFVSAVLSQVCDALHYAHELRDRDGQSLGVIHRDVSLANVFVCESGNAKVLDFGIAKVKDAQGTQTGTVKGKYAYMAPEQLRGEAITRGVDVFALGVVAYEMLSLRRLFQRQTDYLTFHAVLEQPIADLRHYRPDIPPSLLAVVMRALERDQTKRFATVRELGTALADATSRPWAPDQVGQLVSEMFAEDSARRQAAVAKALEHPGSMLDGPPIASNSGDDDDDDGSFPAVETEAGPITGDVKTVIERVAQQRGLPLNPSLVDLAPVPEAPPQPRTSKWIWVVALLVLLTGGGVAVAFVMMNKPPPEKVIIERSDSPNREKDMKRIGEHYSELLACATKHPVKDKQATVDLWIDTTGHAESARFEPATIDTGPLGNCLRGVLGSIQYVTRNEASGVHTSIDLPASKGP